MEQKLTKNQKAANDLIDEVADKFEKLGVKYYISVIDRRGKGVVLSKSSEFNKADLPYFLAPFTQDRERTIALGHTLGNIINSNLTSKKS